MSEGREEGRGYSALPSIWRKTPKVIESTESMLPWLPCANYRVLCPAHEISHKSPGSLAVDGNSARLTNLSKVTQLPRDLAQF